MEPKNGTKAVPLHTDKIVRRLDEFPDLLQALRDGDLLTGRLFCAHLFNLDGRLSRPDEVPPVASRDESSLKTIPSFI
jgi:hypothetical protein